LFLIPTSVQCELVVCEYVRSLLSFGEVIQCDHRHLFQLQLPRGQETTVTGDDTSL
jgi:hypothetical protein